MAGLARRAQVVSLPGCPAHDCVELLTVDDAARAEAATLWDDEERCFEGMGGYDDGCQKVTVRIWDEDGQQYTRIVRPITEFEVEWTDAEG